MMLECVVVYVELPNNYCAYLPDFPGCVGAGKTWIEIQQTIREAAAGHVQAMVKRGEPLPHRAMSLEEAMAGHSEPLTEADKEMLAEFGESPATLSTTFATIELEVNLAPATTGN